MLKLTLILFLVFGCDSAPTEHSHEVDVDWILIRDSNMTQSQGYYYDLPGYYFCYTSDSQIDIHTSSEHNYAPYNIIIDSLYNLSFTYKNELFTYNLNLAQEFGGNDVYYNVLPYEAERIILNQDQNYVTILHGIYPWHLPLRHINTASPNEIVDYR